MVDRAAKLRAAADGADAEAAFSAKKATKGGVNVEDKDELRALRADYRENYRGPPKDGGAAPGVIAAGASVKAAG